MRARAEETGDVDVMSVDLKAGCDHTVSLNHSELSSSLCCCCCSGNTVFFFKMLIPFVQMNDLLHTC